MTGGTVPLIEEGVEAKIPVAGSMEEVMSRNRLGLVVAYAAVLVLFTVASVAAAQYGTAEEAKAMLDRAVAG